MFTTWFGRRVRSKGFRSTAWDVAFFAPLRDIRKNRLALRCRHSFGFVVRYQSCTYIHNVEGRRFGACRSAMCVDGGHHVGCHGRYHGVPSPLLSCVRLVYIDVRKVKRCSVDGVVVRLFLWPTFDVKKAKSVVRILCTNHCQWVDVLIIRGRRWSSQPSYFRSNRVLGNLLWHWQDQGRPLIVYTEDSEAIGGGDLAFGWLMGYGCCVGRDVCQCNWVGVEVSGRPRIINGQGWHHLGMLFSNSGVVFHESARVFECNCRYSQVNTHYPNQDCHKHTMDGLIATKLIRAVVDMFAEVSRDDPQLCPRV